MMASLIKLINQVSVVWLKITTEVVSLDFKVNDEMNHVIIRFQGEDDILQVEGSGSPQGLKHTLPKGSGKRKNI